MKNSLSKFNYTIAVAIILVNMITIGLGQTRLGQTRLGKTPEERIAWWQEARFGMFIHWGVYSIPAYDAWRMYQEHIPVDEYVQLADQFNPRNYNPAEWIAMAKEAGMKYIVITTRHHDGFCLFDSQVSEFTSAKTAAKRDLIAEFADACHQAGMRMGLYYSLVDWRFPGVIPHGTRLADENYEAMVAQAHAQVRELLTNYGKVDILWYDMPIPNDSQLWRSEELNAMARELQPDIIINDRAAIPGDFATPENTVIAQNRPWESCYSMNRSWGYARYDRNYKPVNELLRLLASCASQGGNFLLNVGPDAEGRFPVEAVERLRSIGQWMRVNGKAIYGARPSPVGAPNLGMETMVDNKVYLLLQRWPGSTVPIAWCGSKVKSARLLATGQYATVEQDGDRVWMHGFPEYPVDPYLNVIELIFEGKPRPSEPAYR
jgi:alpha-L-fucosidase